MEWKFNGRAVPLGQLGNVVAKSFAEAAVEQAKAAVARIPCPVHGTGATNINVTRNGNHLNFTYEACCDRLKEAINGAAA